MTVYPLTLPFIQQPTGIDKNVAKVEENLTIMLDLNFPLSNCLLPLRAKNFVFEFDVL
jgi:hypothetical protein